MREVRDLDSKYSRDFVFSFFNPGVPSYFSGMSTPRRWFDRKFELGLAPDSAAQLIERLRGTPQRLEDAVRGLSSEVLTRKREGKWSIQENAGHLLDLESLWDQRLDDYDAGTRDLHPADLENRKTHEAAHNDRPISEILAEFSSVRGRIVERLAGMNSEELSRTALHPRLQQPMSVVDLCFFVAEHDDHHLRTIEELKSDL
jgi:uncharacterized damage-inducible protein DinB